MGSEMCIRDRYIIRSFFALSNFQGAINYIESIKNDFEDEHQIHYYLGASYCAVDEFENSKNTNSENNSQQDINKTTNRSKIPADLLWLIR